MMCWIPDDIEKISESMAPCALERSGTNTLSKVFQVRRVRQSAPSLIYTTPLPASPSFTPLPSPTTIFTREHPPCVSTFTNRTNNRENNDIQSLITTTATALVCYQGLEHLLLSN